MGHNKRMDFGAGVAVTTGETPAQAPRARNRTVMLTSEVTGQVRARLLEEVDQETPQLALDAPEGMMEPQPESSDFAVPVVRKQSDSASFSLFDDPGEALTEPAQEVSAPLAERPPRSTARETARDRGISMNANEKQNIFWTKETPVIGMLVSFDKNPNGEVFVLRSGRLVVSSEAPTSGSYMLIEDDSVSPNHAILRISAGGEVQVLDQLSENGTRIQRFGAEEEEELSGDKSSVEHGDCISFGQRKFFLCILPVGA